MMTKEDMLDALLRGLLAEGWTDSQMAVPQDGASKRHLLRALMNTRPPLPARPELIRLQDRFLSEERAASSVTDPCQLPALRDVFGGGDPPFRDRFGALERRHHHLDGGRYRQRGELETARVLYSSPPMHRQCHPLCAGIQLRLECNQIMEDQGGDEPLAGRKSPRATTCPPAM